MYPEITPFFTASLAVSPRHSLHVERSGTRGGCPIFFLHGGPGSQTRPAHRRYFDPDFFDIVLFDQRGCRRSTPAGETTDNTLWHLLDDINAISAALGITGKICLFGGSWGSTVALAYASAHPERVEELLLRGLFLGTDDEVRWFTEGLSRFAPQAWNAFATPADENLLVRYFEQVNGPDDALAHTAARRWIEYENSLMRIDSGAEIGAAASAAASTELLARVRIHLHYLMHHCFLDATPLLERASSLQVPVTLVQGELDLICPPHTAWSLSQRLPQARLRLVPGAGHNALSAKLADALIQETDALRDRLRRRQELTP